jgi:hypothetical protein
MTVFIEIDAAYNIPPMIAVMFATLTKLSKTGVLK